MRRQEKAEERYTREHVLLLLLAPCAPWAAKLLVEAVEAAEAVEGCGGTAGDSAGPRDVKQFAPSRASFAAPRGGTCPAATAHSGARLGRRVAC